ncbi:MAG: cytochrome ubiquinol oxidase subunit I [Chlamydiota bacterium]
MDTLLLSRIQFALNIAFHFIYPPLSIGLAIYLVLFEGLYLKTKKPHYRRLVVFWIKIFALIFAIGVATGLVQTFAFGTNWARYSRFVGDVFGSALAAEGIFAFFLEAGFLGVLLFGMDRVKPLTHYVSTICVAIGAHFSAIWIIVVNSWMQTPAGYAIEGTGAKAKAVVTSFWDMVFNPSSIDRLIHVILGCWLAGSFFMLSVGCYYLVKKRYEKESLCMVKTSLIVAVVVLLLQVISGDSSAKIVAKYQPTKLAAMEGIYETTEYTPLSIMGWVDPKKERVYGIRVPGMLSFLVYQDPKTPVPGLDQVPKEDWPNVPLVFQFYHAMLACWFLMFLITLFGLYSWRKGRLTQSRSFLWPGVFSVVLPQVALQTGWFAAEMGRQPWIIYGVMRTSDGVSTTLVKEQLIGSMTMFVLIYLLLFCLFIFLLDRKIKHGLSIEEEDLASSVYSDVFSES